MAEEPVDEIQELQGLLQELFQNTTQIRENQDKLCARVDELEGTVKEQREGVARGLKSLNEAFAQNLTQLGKKLRAEYEESVQALSTSLEEATAAVREELKTEVLNASQGREELESRLNTKLEEFQTALSGEISQHRSDLEKQLEEHQTALATTQSSLEETASTLSSYSSKTDDSLAALNTTLAELANQQSTQKTEFDQALEEQMTQTKDLVENLNQDVSLRISMAEEGTKDLKVQHNEELTSLRTDVDTRFEDVRSELAEQGKKQEERSNTLENDLTEALSVMNEAMKAQFDQIHGMLSELRSKTGKRFTEVDDQVSQIFDVIKGHAEALNSLNQTYVSVRKALDESMDDVKEEQNSLMNAYQKIVTGSTENLRNELIIISKEIRTILAQFQKEIEDSFSTKDDTSKIEDRVRTLDTDLREKSDQIRKQLVSSLDQSVQNFEGSIKEAIQSVEVYRVELERFKDDIESMIERKVNEKNEFILELMSNLVKKTERLGSLVRETRLEPPPQLMVPIPGVIEKGSSNRSSAESPPEDNSHDEVGD